MTPLGGRFNMAVGADVVALPGQDGSTGGSILGAVGDGCALGDGLLGMLCVKNRSGLGSIGGARLGSMGGVPGADEREDRPDEREPAIERGVGGAEGALGRGLGGCIVGSAAGGGKEGGWPVGPAVVEANLSVAGVAVIGTSFSFGGGAGAMRCLWGTGGARHFWDLWDGACTSDCGSAYVLGVSTAMPVPPAAAAAAGWLAPIKGSGTATADGGAADGGAADGGASSVAQKETFCFASGTGDAGRTCTLDLLRRLAKLSSRLSWIPFGFFFALKPDVIPDQKPTFRSFCAASSSCSTSLSSSLSSSVRMLPSSSTSSRCGSRMTVSRASFSC